ncbi:hypothetical protein M5689_005146 [Euphorbia peplus]|nr:hypothetical protein M5689_005146 [Euphorbia peplus]
MKLNADGSRLISGSISAGGILRDDAGAWKAGFVHNIGIGSSFNAELWGLHTGLTLAKDIGVDKLLVESDNLEVINCLSKSKEGNSNSMTLIKYIHRCIKEFQQISFQHVYREVNKLADQLPRLAHEFPLGVTKLESPPRLVSRLLLDDNTGAVFPRLIPG